MQVSDQDFGGKSSLSGWWERESTKKEDWIVGGREIKTRKEGKKIRLRRARRGKGPWSPFGKERLIVPVFKRKEGVSQGGGGGGETNSPSSWRGKKQLSKETDED